MLWPNAYVTAGHQIIGECREYERGVTAAVNGSVQPILDRYLKSKLRSRTVDWTAISSSCRATAARLPRS